VVFPGERQRGATGHCLRPDSTCRSPSVVPLVPAASARRTAGQLITLARLRWRTLGFPHTLAYLLRCRATNAAVPAAPGLQDAARDITAPGGVTTLTLLTGLTAGFLLLDGKKRMALFLCGSVVSGFLVSTLLKTMFQRPDRTASLRSATFRPPAVPAAIRCYLP